MHRNKTFSLLLTILFLPGVILAQKNINSPFARYGIGNLENRGTFRTLAMGGISSGLRDNMTLNYLTPASYSSIDTASFIFDFGVDFATIGLKNGAEEYFSTDMNFTHLMVGFPIMKNWGFSAGVVPYSDGFYEISELTTPDEEGEEVAGDVVDYHKGIGGYQKFFFGTGFSPVKYVSAGINMFILFGEIDRTNESVFTEDNNYFNVRKAYTHSMRGIGYDASLQFMLPLPERWYVNAGVTFSPGFDLKTSNDTLILRFSNIQTSGLAFDTLYTSLIESESHIPQSMRGGIAFGKKDKLTVGLDAAYSWWSEASLPGSSGTYADALSLHLGAEYIPDKYSNYSYFDRVEYRIGCRYSESYAMFAGSQVKEYGITFGAGIPMRRSRSRTSLFIDLSKRGNPDGDLFRETRLTVGASLNLFDYWFLKPKYD